MSGTPDTSGAHGTDSTLARGYRADPYTGAVRMDVGMSAARLVRVMAFVCIAARLFSIYASANRISVCRALLRTSNENGELDAYSPASATLFRNAQDADSIYTTAFILLLATFVVYLVAIVRLGVRAKRGDALAKAINTNRANRVAGRLYLVAALGAITAQNLFKVRSDMPPRVRWTDLLHMDTANIVVQVVVIAFLLILGLVANREIEGAYTDPRDL